MSGHLDLRDIQGNITRAYGRFGYPHARYFLFNISDNVAGRDFIRSLVPLVTTAERWSGPENASQAGLVQRPLVTLNVALTWRGLEALKLPTATLAGFPREYIDGMPKRAPILSDQGPSAPQNWDPVWRGNASADGAQHVHVMVTLNAQMQEDGSPVDALEARTEWLRERGAGAGVTLLTGHDRTGAADYQQAGAKLVKDATGRLTIDGSEHFGFEDGIGNPVFAGQYPSAVEKRRVKGRGKIMPDQSWAPLATGEILIGHVDESQELPATTTPPSFMDNGTFFAFRKLHENVQTFRDYMEGQAENYAIVNKVSKDEAGLTLRAKMAGRWPSGLPLMAAPTYADMLRLEAEWKDIPAIKNKSGRRTPAEQARLDAFNEMLINFSYKDDQDGACCPIGAHIRRGNMRDMLDPALNSKNPKDWTGSALTNRRRILRRGLPYGDFEPEVDTDDAERGVIFIAMCADIFRQFEFVQQQWINYGLDFNLGNDNCPLLGYHPNADTPRGMKHMVQADPTGDGSPWVMPRLPQFVETRGGDYFFVPSISTLGAIALGVVDPT